MKQATLLAVFIAVVCCGNAETVQQQVAFRGYSDSALVTPSGIQDMLQKIIDATGSQLNFELKEANVLNIETKLTHRKRVILYNQASNSSSGLLPPFRMT